MSKKILTGLAVIAVLISGIYIYSYNNPSESALFPKCPFYVITGYKCAGCGFQRALHNFLIGNFKESFSCNPIIFLLLPYVLILIFLEYFFDKSHSIVQKLRKILLGKWTIIAVMTVIALFAVLRNF